MEETQLTPLELRRLEVAQYATNISMYEAMAADLPSVYPKRLESYKGSKDQHSDIAKVTAMADVELLSDLWAHDAAVAAIRSETVEKRKAEAILRVLEANATA
jgi:hypothetical protein